MNMESNQQVADTSDLVDLVTPWVSSNNHNSLSPIFIGL